MAPAKLSRRGLLVLTTLATSITGSLTFSPRDASLPDPSSLVNLTTFPECATADCVASQSFLSSRLGCQNNTLTVGCFCDEALTPLNCVSTGPSDEDTCWSQSEDWMLGVCGTVTLVPKDTMPDCIVECVATYLIDSGCGPTNGTVSRNCFCKLAQLDAKLDKPKLPSTINKCKKGGCWRNMKPGFDYEEWKDGICTHGVSETYDQWAYEDHVQTIKDTRIAIPVVIPVFSVLGGLLCVSIAGRGYTFNFLAGWIVSMAVLYLVILPPLYLAL